MAGVLPVSLTNRMFSTYTDASFTPSASGEKHYISTGTGTFLILVKQRGNNNDHMSSHIFQSAGLYVKTLNTLTNVNYNNNTSISIEPAEYGKGGFYITLNYTSIYGAVAVDIFLFK